MRWLSYLLVPLALAAPAGAHAATRNVCSSGCAYNTIGAAITAAGDGDTILVSEGRYDQVIRITGKELIIEGAGAGATFDPPWTGGGNITNQVEVNGGKVTFRNLTIGQRQKRCMFIQGGAEVTLDNVTVEECSLGEDGPGAYVTGSSTLHLINGTRFLNNGRDANDKRGGHIFMDGGTLTAVGAEFRGGFVEGAGGAIYATGAELQLTNVVFDDNEVEDNGNDSGGAIAAFSNSHVTLVGGTFNNNRARNDGGAIYVEDSDLDIDGTVFTDNYTVTDDDDGGAIAAESSTVDILNAQFTGNRAANDARGGAVYVTDTALTVKGSTFHNNYNTDTAEDGGMIFAESGSSVLIEDTAFARVGASPPATLGRHGGAIYVNGGSLVVRGTSSFQDLASTGAGGAIHVFGATVDLSGASFLNNEGNGGWGGGAVFIRNSATTCTLSDSTFDGNSHRWRGGALAIRDSSCTLTNGVMSQVAMSANTAQDGGDVAVGSSDLVVEGGAFAGVATGDGGAFFVEDSDAGASTLSVTDADIEGASAGDGGGAIYSIEGSDVTLKGVELSQSVAGATGGHVYIEGGQLTIQASALRGSVLEHGSATHAGAIDAGSDTVLLIEDAHFLDNSAPGHAGAIRWQPGWGDGSLTIRRSSFVGNVADSNASGGGDGGVVRTDGGGTVLIEDSWFEANEGFYAGGLYLKDVTHLKAYRNTFCMNEALHSGAAIYLEGSSSDTDLRSNIFQEQSGTFGAALYVKDTDHATIFNNHFLGNTSTNNEGAVYFHGSTLTFVNNLVAWSSGRGVRSNDPLARFDYNAWWQNQAVDNRIDGTNNLYGPGDQQDDPLLTNYSLDGDCSNDVLWPLADPQGSLVNKGDPALTDPLDGSRSDIGAYGGTEQPLAPFQDQDGDGFAPVDGDCNDADETIHPGADELPGDGIDQDCDGVELCYIDGDGDGFGIVNTTLSTDLTCDGSGLSYNTEDCDDGAILVNPDAEEIPGDGVDQDCDGLELCYMDLDGDGAAGEDTHAIADFACAADGYAPEATDCNDANPNIHPGQTEDPHNGVDQDCDGLELCYEDADLDGVGSDVLVGSADLSCTTPGVAPVSGDCRDDDDSIHPEATEGVADGIDQDCDGLELCYEDADVDGHGSTKQVDSSDLTCTADGVSSRSDDCDDANPAIHPSADEVPGDGIDQDCNGVELCWVDGDDDGFGDPSRTELSVDLSCAHDGLAANGDDCNDVRGDIHPDAAEVAADGVDQDCDELELCYQDADGDGYGVGLTVLSSSLTCEGPQEADNPDDCDDTESTVYPGATEIVADGVDQDCNEKELCYQDADDDGFGVDTPRESAVGDLACAGSNLSTRKDDCLDTNPNVYPGATEIPANGLDEDCDNLELCFVDNDGDDYGTATTTPSASLTCNGFDISRFSNDCDDGNAAIYPGAPEVREDGIDQDCDGFDLLGCFEDLDGDSYGSNVVIDSTNPDCDGVGESLVQTDCNDADVDIHPGAVDICGDGIDQNCDGAGSGTDDEDGDGLDFLTEQLWGTSDCDPDSDADGVQDGDEVLLGLIPTNPDTDGDGVPDGIEVGPAPALAYDTDEDGIIDALDPDDDGDDIPTAMEDYSGGGPMNEDTDGDNIPDYLDTDDDGDSLLTRDEGTMDWDFDGTPDYLDDDDDGDGIPTLVEVTSHNPVDGVSGNHLGLDSDGDGIPDSLEWPQDSDDDGYADFIDLDDDGDGIPTVIEGPGDVDNDGIPNYLDEDSDGDGKPDSVEGTGDDDSDTIPNFIDKDDSDGGAGDPDGDGLTTGEELRAGTLPNDPDTDNDGVPDGMEVGDPDAPNDTDGDNIPDWEDTDDDGDGARTAWETGLCPVGLDLEGLPIVPVLSSPDGQIVVTCSDGSPPADPAVYLDTDGDETPDWADDDDDGDGVPSALEDRNGNGDLFDDDTDGDGIPDFRDATDFEGQGDADGDGLSFELEQELGTDPYRADSDGDGLPDGYEIGPNVNQPWDTDGDGIIDALDSDDDGDSIPTLLEGLGDVDGDGVPNYRDEDSDGDGKPDAVELTGDADCDGILNYVDPDDSDGACGGPPAAEDHVISFQPGCGCDSSGLGAGWLVLALAAFAVRRRKAA